MIRLLYIIIMTLHNISEQIDDAVDRRIPWELFLGLTVRLKGATERQMSSLVSGTM